jgi:hypothetical protein
VSKLFYLVKMLCFRLKEGLNHLHEQFMQFLKGQAIEQLPLVLRLRNKLRCIPCVETLVEALHKKSKQEGLGRYNIGAATVSCRQRLSRLSYRLENEAGFLQRLAGKCDSTRSMHDIVVALGISTHPALLKKFAESRYIAESGGDAFCDSLPSGADLREFLVGQKNHPIVEAIIYRSDALTQFSNLDAFKSDLAKDKADTSNKDMTRSGTDASGAVGAEPPSADKFGEIISAAAKGHLADTTCHDKYYSLHGGLHRGEQSLRPLLAPVEQYLTSIPRLADFGDSEIGRMELECEDGGLMPAATDEVVVHSGLNFDSTSDVGDGGTDAVGTGLSNPSSAVKGSETAIVGDHVPADAPPNVWVIRVVHRRPQAQKILWPNSVRGSPTMIWRYVRIQSLA